MSSARQASDLGTAPAAEPSAQTDIGRRNVVWGWATIVLGVVSGAILMSWSFAGPFPTPPGFHDYADLTRRMVRLAHIAMFMLPLINIALGHDLDSLPLSSKWKQICSWCGLIGMVGVPLGLILGGLVHIWLKLVAVPGVYAFMLALGIMGVGKLKGERLRRAGRAS